ncbi:MAG: potassium-transporting ATPase subunit C, partial [Candidatus Saccharimonas sp.]|nr:potassium-transporting ATPase subunit C [Planctomycetaceae bacterium]
FSEPRYFWSRLSATGPVPYTAFNGETLTGSSGSNYGPLNPALIEAAKGRIDALHAADPEQTSPVPVDLITASGSGLDPHISLAAAEYQVARVAAARKMPVKEIIELIRQHTSGRQLGVLGEPGVNVLQLNQALDGVKPEKRVTREGIHPFGFGRFQRTVE